MRRTKVVSVSMPAEMFSRAEELARSEHRTISELVREALRAYEALRFRTKPPLGSGTKATASTQGGQKNSRMTRKGSSDKRM
jgi:Arc/MetJ-type ribon-helix-helix transcriptional regulator